MDPGDQDIQKALRLSREESEREHELLIAAALEQSLLEDHQVGAVSDDDPDLLAAIAASLHAAPSTDGDGAPREEEEASLPPAAIPKEELCSAVRECLEDHPPYASDRKETTQSRYKAFLCYGCAPTDSSVKDYTESLIRPLHEILKEKGVPNFFDQSHDLGDDSAIKLGTDGQQKIASALYQAEVGLVFVSLQLFSSEGGLRELSTMFERLLAPSDENFRVVPVFCGDVGPWSFPKKLDPYAPVLEWLSSTSGIDNIHYMWRKLDDFASLDVVPRLLHLFGANRGDFPGATMSPSTEKRRGVLVGVPPQAPFSTGMLETHKRVTDRLPLGWPGRVAVCGLGGVGKSSLSSAIAMEGHASGRYPGGVFWVNAENEVTAATSTAALLEALEVPVKNISAGDAAKAMQKTLANMRGWLLVFDNADTFEAVKSRLPAAKSFGHVIVTSRMSASEVVATNVFKSAEQVVTVGLLPPHHALDLLCKAAGRTASSLDQDERGAAEWLAGRDGLNGLPLALEHAGGMLRATPGETFQGYKKEYVQRGADIFPGEVPADILRKITEFLQQEDLFEAVKAAMELEGEKRGRPWLLADVADLKIDNVTGLYEKQRRRLRKYFDRLLEMVAAANVKRTVRNTWLPLYYLLKKDNMQSAKLLRFCSFMAADLIPEELAASLLESPGADGCAAQQEIWHPLARVSLVAQIGDARAYSIHRLVQDVVREEIEGNMAEEATYDAVVDACLAVLKPVEYETEDDYVVSRRWLPHALAVSKRQSWWPSPPKAGDAPDSPDDPLPTLFVLAGHALMEHGLPAKDWTPALVSAAERWVDLRRILCMEYYQEGAYDQELEVLEKMVKDLEKPPQPGRESIQGEALYGAYEQSRYAMIMGERGRHKDAMTAVQATNNIVEAALMGDRWSKKGLLQVITNLAKALTMCIPVDPKPEEVLQQAVHILEPLLAPDHLEVARLYYDLAVVRHTREMATGGPLPEDPKGTAEVYLEAQRRLRRALPEGHPHIGEALCGYGKHLSDTNQFAAAETAFREGLAILQEALPPDHPKIDLFKNNLDEVQLRRDALARAVSLKCVADTREQEAELTQALQALDAQLACESGSGDDVFNRLAHAVRLCVELEMRDKAIEVCLMVLDDVRKRDERLLLAAHARLRDVFAAHAGASSWCQVMHRQELARLRDAPPQHKVAAQISYAEFLMEHGCYAEAERWCSKALKLHTGLPPSTLRVLCRAIEGQNDSSRHAEEHGCYAEAEKLCSKALKLHTGLPPGSAVSTLRLLCRAIEGQNDSSRHAEVETLLCGAFALNNAPAVNGTYTGDLLSDAAMYEKSRGLEEALEFRFNVLRELCKLHSEKREFLFVGLAHIVRVAYNSTKPDVAISACLHIVNRDNVRFRNEEERQLTFDKARKVLHTKFLESPEVALKLTFLFANDLEKNGLYEAAEARFREVAEKLAISFPEQSMLEVSRNALLNVLQRQGKREEKEATCCFFTGFSLFYAERFEEAQAMFKKAYILRAKLYPAGHPLLEKYKWTLTLKRPPV